VTIEAEIGSETPGFHPQLTRIFAREEFIKNTTVTESEEVNFQVLPLENNVYSWGRTFFLACFPLPLF
jgi:hypothetical protein